MIEGLLWASLGTLGFGLIFNANKNKLIYILISGFLNYFAYALTYQLSHNLFLASFICAAITYIYSVIMARVSKCPSVIYVLTGLIPSVPGSYLFYTMQNIVLGNQSLASKYALITTEVILGIASGIALFSMLFNLYKDIKNKH